MKVPFFDEIDESTVASIERCLEDGGLDHLVDNILYTFEKNRDYGYSASQQLELFIQELQKRQAE
jgi:hypothetical protein